MLNTQESTDGEIRIIIADDHAMFREGLRAFLRLTPDIVVLGEVESGEAAVALSTRLRPDVLVLDLDMPEGDGKFALRELIKSLPDLRVLILTQHGEADRLLPLLEAGASGYLPKGAPARELVTAIRTVARGEVYVRPGVARMLATALVPQRVAQTARGRFKALSEREQTVVRMVAQGYSGAEIARSLTISQKTVEAYKNRVRQKLGLAHRTDYVHFAVQAGLFDG